MIHEARGQFERSEGLTDVPRVRVGIGFGRDRVASISAVVDTGADVCVFPSELFPWTLSAVRSGVILVQNVWGDSRPAIVYYPSVTVGTIRVNGVASIVSAGVEALLGRSFLNRMELRLSEQKNLVLLRETERSGHAEIPGDV
jgi:hypothetical protein